MSESEKAPENNPAADKEEIEAENFEVSDYSGTDEELLGGSTSSSSSSSSSSTCS